MAIQNAHSEDSDRTVQMRRLIWIFAGHKSEGMFSDVSLSIWTPKQSFCWAHCEEPVVQSIYMGTANWSAPVNAWRVYYENTPIQI